MGRPRKYKYEGDPAKAAAKRAREKVKKRMAEDPQYAEEIRAKRSEYARKLNKKIKRRMKRDPEFAEKMRKKQHDYNKKCQLKKKRADPAGYREAAREINRKQYAKNKKKFQLASRDYYYAHRDDPDWLEKTRAKTREWQLSRRGLEHMRKYREAHRDQQQKSNRDWARRNPKKSQAHYLVSLALKRGDLKKPEICSECSSKKMVEAHHDDYSKPLDVRWLCRMCHRRAHTTTHGVGSLGWRKGRRAAQRRPKKKIKKRA